MTPQQWPAARDFQEAIQNPSYSFTDPGLRALTPALDRLGMPIVTSGQFAYVFKLNEPSGSSAQAVRCFRGFLGDREQRYRAINKHLDSTLIPCVAGFDYDSEGISVLGRHYPIMVMEWINGLPLDVYIGDVFQRPDVLRYLADLWLKVIASLKSAGVSHGDLQHGNIIIQNEDLRLVDLDGMFVPEMAGWRASEVGHRHYQHLKRSVQHFANGLDNFSALVIYISFLAIAEAPELWREFHDENLIFTETDYKEPGSSKLFGKLKTIGAVRSFVTTLEAACGRGPLDCPYLLDLVAPPSKLPAWMRQAPVVQTKTLTREAQAKSNVPPSVQTQFRREVIGPASAPAAPGWQYGPPGPSHSTAGSTTAPIAPSVAARLPQLSVVSPEFFSRPVFSQALNYATAWLVWSWLWFPVLFAVLHNAGSTAQAAGLMTLGCYVMFCYLVSYRAVTRAVSPQMAPPKPIPVVNVSGQQPLYPYQSQGTTASPIPVVKGPARQPPYRPQYQSSTTGSRSSSGAGSVSFVGSRVSQIYHSPTCSWAYKIRARNRITFASAAQASSRGFRPCGVCRP
jgi:hypothetical protein